MADNLAVPQVAAAQNQKEVTINAATQQLSSALADYISVSLASADYTLSAANFQTYFGFTATLNTVARAFNLPVVKRSLFYIQNSGTFKLSVVLGATTLTVAAGAVAFFQTDGTANGLAAVVPVAPIGTAEIDIGLVFSGQPTLSQVVNYPINQPLTLKASLTGSQFFVGTNPTATAVFNIFHVVAGTPTNVGNLSIATGGAVTVTFAADVAFAIGDVFRVTAPSPQDATLADVGLNFKFVK